MRAFSGRSPSGSRVACSSRTRFRADAMRRAGANPDRLFRYPGLKEDYYLADFSRTEQSSTSSGSTRIECSL